MNPPKLPAKIPWWYVIFFRFPRFIFSKIARILPIKFLKPFNILWMKLTFRWCTKRRHGVWTLYCDADRPDERFFSACETALTLLFEHDARHYQRVRALLQNIVLWSTGQSFFEPFTCSCVINDYDPNRPDSLASTLVHESTHAYLYSKGLRYADNPRRHEKICVVEEFRSIKRMSMTRWPDLSDENRNKWLKQWSDYFEDEMKSEWWEFHQRDTTALEYLRKLSAEP